MRFFKFHYAIVIFISVLLTSCQSQLTREVIDLTERRYDAISVRCGNSLYQMHYEWDYDPSCLSGYEIQGLEIRAEPNELSAADRANGIEWDGYVIVDCNIQRYLWCGEWWAWEDCSPSRTRVSKRNGYWSEDWLNNPEIRSTDITCEEIPRQ